jgi:hypothetical protein
MPILYGGDRVTIVPDAVADAFRPGDRFLQLDPRAGGAGVVARIHGHRPRGLAVTRNRLSVAIPATGHVWVFGRRDGRPPCVSVPASV